MRREDRRYYRRSGPPRSEGRAMAKSYLKIYWKTAFLILFPVALLPLFILHNTPEFRCMYVVLLMAGYWVTEVLPLPVTSLIPLVLFPLMGILNSKKVAVCYMKDANIMFVGGLIIALAVEHCRLHTRVALYVIKAVGCSPKKLNVGLCSVTMFVSMWISNTAATAMMIPIVDATLKALEEQGIGEMFEPQEFDEANPDEERVRKPTKQTMCYFVSTAYASAIGGIGCVIGSGTNIAFKGLYETLYPQSSGVEFTRWMLLNVPMMIVMLIGTVLWLQFWYMGLFRPGSKDAKRIKIGSQGEIVAQKLIKQQIQELGPMSFHEKLVGIMFILSILLWFLRKPQFIPGWAEYITDIQVSDSNVAILVSMLLFMLPAKPDFFYMCSKDETKRPTAPSPPLVTWKFIQQKMPWGLIFLLGGGFAMADAAKESKMSTLIAEQLQTITSLNKVYVMIITCLTVICLTQIASNVAVASVVLPVVSEMCTVAKIHPMYLMMPAALSCSFSYCLPSSTPPNAIVVAPCNMSTWEMVKVGAGVTVISLAVVFAIFPFYAPYIWDMDTFPEWAQRKNDSVNNV